MKIMVLLPSQISGAVLDIKMDYHFDNLTPKP